MSKPKKFMTGALLRLSLPALMLMTLPGCMTLTTATTPIVVDTVCDAVTPLTYSTSGDTPETVAGIKGHNRVMKALCP